MKFFTKSSGKAIAFFLTFLFTLIFNQSYAGSFTASGGTLSLDLDVASQLVTVVSTGTTYTFTLSGGASNTWTGTTSSSVSVSGAVLTVTATGLSTFNAFNITDSQSGNAVTFSASGPNAYADNFFVNLNNTPGAVTFIGSSSFTGSNGINITTSMYIVFLASSRLSAVNGSIYLSANTQETPSSFLYSGIKVDAASVEITGTGILTITARGGSGAYASYNNKGIAVVNGGTIKGGTTGTMTLVGRGFTGETGSLQAQGVYVNSLNVASPSIISSNGANVSVTGYGAQSTAIGVSNLCNSGVAVGTGTNTTATVYATITAGGNGSVTVIGYGGAAANPASQVSTHCHGVSVTGSNALISSDGSGKVTVTGNGAGPDSLADNNHGVLVFNGIISAGTSADLEVTGTGGNSASGLSYGCGGVMLQGATAQILGGSGYGTTLVTGYGGGRKSLTNNFGVTISVLGRISSNGSGSVTVKGYGGNTTGSGSFNYGVRLMGNNSGTYTYITSNGGDVRVEGTGGGGTGTQYNVGVDVNVASAIVAGGYGNVTVIGNGGNNSGTTGNTNFGVQITSSGSGQPEGYISSNGGNVSVTGTGGGGNAASPAASASSNNFGVFCDQGGYITAVGSGTVTVTGTGGNTSPGATGATNHGVYVSPFALKGGSGLYSTRITSDGGNLIVSGIGGGNGTGTNNQGVCIKGLIKAAGNGTLSITGTGGNTVSGASSWGVSVDGSPTVNSVVYPATVTTISGAVTVTGIGGGIAGTSIAGSNYGVYVNAGGKITAGTGADVTISGTGGNSNGQQNFGVLVNGGAAPNQSTITSGGGNVSITGTGPQSTAGGNQHGVQVASAVISSGGDGNVTIIGNAGKGDLLASGNGHVGVMVTGSTALITTAGTGTLTVTGNGGGDGTRTNNYGILVNSGGGITSGGWGTVTLNGNGGGLTGTGAANCGVFVTGANSRITSGGGNVIINGTEGGASTSLAVDVESSGTISTATNGGDITIKGNSLKLATATLAAAAAANLNIIPLTTGTIVNFSSSTDAKGTMTITSTELGLMSGGNINIGNSSTGVVSIYQALTVPSTSNLNLATASSPAGLSPKLDGTEITMGSGKTLGLSGIPLLKIAISGNTANTQYDQLMVAGDVTLTGLSLSLSGGYTPKGGDVFTLVSATSITGTFSGLANGATVTFNNVPLTINYTTTTVTLTAPCTNPGTGGTIAGAQSGNSPFDPSAFTSSDAASGNFGVLEYKWKQSTTDASTDFTDIASSNTATYDPGSLTTTTWFKRLARVACKADWTGAVESNVLEVTVILLSPSPLAQPTNLYFSNTKTGSKMNIVLHYTASASAESYLVVRKTGSAPSFVPLSGTAYTAGPQGSDTIVYVGSALNCADTTVNAESVYYYAVYALNGNGTASNYFTTNPLSGNSQAYIVSLAAVPTTTATTSAGFPNPGGNVTFTAGANAPGTTLNLTKTNAAPVSNFSALPGVRGVRNLYYTINSTNATPGSYTLVMDMSELGLSQAQWNAFKILKRADNTKPWADISTLGGTVLNRQTDGAWGKFAITGLNSFSEFAGGLPAVTRTVTSASETGPGSLKEAILDSWAGDIIVFDTAAMGGNRIVLSAPVEIDSSLTIRAPGGGIILDGNHAIRVMTIYHGANVRLENLKIQNGNDPAYFVGGIYTSGNLTMINCLVADNASEGSLAVGGILQYDDYETSITDTLNLVNCTITNNTGDVTNGTGGISGEGQVNIYNSIIYGNTAGYYNDLDGTKTISKSYNSLYGEDVLPLIDTAYFNYFERNPRFTGNILNPYTLQDTSVCRNAGDTIYNFMQTDLAGFPRVSELAIDLGAFEFTCINPIAAGVIGSDQTICYGSSPASLTNTTFPSGHAGQLEYKWQSSVTSDTTGFVDIVSSNNATYAPGSLTDTTWFRRAVRVSCYADWSGVTYSNAIKITINLSAPAVATQAHDSITSSSVKLHGSLNLVCPNAGSRGAVYYEYSNTDKLIGDFGVSNASETGNFGGGTFYSRLSGLTANTLYNYRLHATDSLGTGYGTRQDFRTLAATPAAPTVNNPKTTTLDVAVNVNGNPTATEFAIQDTVNGTYVQADGSRAATAVWQNATDWGTKTVTGLTTGTTYIFRLKARNGDHLETAFGPTGSGIPCTLPSISSQSTTAQTRCAGESFTSISVNALGSALNFQWFSNTLADTTGMTSLGAANGAQTYTYTPQSAIEGTLYFYCRVSNSCGSEMSAVSGAMTTYSLTPPAAPLANGTNVCKGNSATLSAIGTGTLGWYDAAIGGNWLHGGNDFTSPALNTTTTYYVQDSSCSVSATRTAVTVNISNICVTEAAGIITLNISDEGTSIKDLHTTFSGMNLIITAVNTQNLIALSNGLSAGISTDETSTVIVDLSSYSGFAGISVLGGASTDSVSIGSGGINLSTIPGGSSNQSLRIDIGSANDQLTIANPISAKGAGSIYLNAALAYSIDAQLSADTLTIVSDGNVSQSEAISANHLRIGQGQMLFSCLDTISNSGNYTLTNSLNDVVNFSARTSGSIDYNDLNGVVIKGNGAKVNGDFTITAGGNLEVTECGIFNPGSTGNINFSTSKGTILIKSNGLSSGGNVSLSSADSTVTITDGGLITKGNVSATSYRNLRVGGSGINNTSGTGNVTLTSSHGSLLVTDGGLQSKGKITIVADSNIKITGGGIANTTGTGVDLISTLGTIIVEAGGISSGGNVNVTGHGAITSDANGINTGSGPGNIYITSNAGSFANLSGGTLLSNGKIVLLTFGDITIGTSGITNIIGTNIISLTSSNGAISIQGAGIISKDSIAVIASGNISITGNGVNNAAGNGLVTLLSQHGIVSVDQGGVNAKDNAIVQTDNLSVLNSSLKSINKKVSVYPANADIVIDMGGIDATGILGISDAELNYITADTVAIGDTTNTANIEVSSTITDSQHKLIFITKPTAGITLRDNLIVNDVDISRTHTYSTTILSRTSAHFMRVSGSVELGTNTVLVLSTPVSGFVVGDVIRIIDNTFLGFISGEFYGLPQNSYISILDGLGTTVHFMISYVGGDGNDVEIIVVERIPMVAWVEVEGVVFDPISGIAASASGNIVAINGANATNRGAIIFPYTGSDKIIGDPGVTNVDLDGDFGLGTYPVSFSGLTINAHYSARAHATNSFGIGYSTRSDFWTMANVPDAPTVNNPTATSLDVAVNENANPVTTEFAIQDSINGTFVQSGGTMGASAVWKTALEWGTKTVSGLSTGVTYYFRVKARNGGNVETAYSLSTGMNTCSNPTSGGTIATSQNICYGDTPNALSSIEAASGYGGILEYKWQYSTSSASAGFVDIAFSNAETYTPGALSKTTWYKRLSRVGCKEDWLGAAESNVIKLTVQGLYGTFTIGSGGMFTTLTGANGLFQTLNTYGMCGDVTASIISNITEPGIFALNQWVESGAGGYYLYVRPASASEKTLQGNFSLALIRLNGADKVQFDGTSNGDGPYLRFRNNNTLAPTFSIANGSLGASITNCTIEGSNNTANSGVVTIGTASPDMYNGLMSFMGNVFQPATTPPANYFYVAGTPARPNNMVFIMFNEFKNFKSNGLYITATGNGSYWYLSGNTFYNDVTANTAQTAINFIPGLTSSNNNISNNNIGGSTNTNTGTWTNSGAVTFKGISVNAAYTDVNANRIQNMNLSNTAQLNFMGIELLGGAAMIRSNVVGNEFTENSISMAGLANFFGIRSVSTSTNVAISGNLIANITNTCLTGYPNFYGIYTKGGAITENEVFNLGTSTTTANPAVFGIEVLGINGSIAYCVNNMLALKGGNALNPKIFGIQDNGYAATANLPIGHYAHNSVEISGNATTCSKTYAFQRNYNSVINLANNIFSNKRSSSPVGHYAIGSANTTAWTSNNNDLFVNSSKLGVWGTTDQNNLAAWKLATGQDAASLSVAPVFVSAINLHLTLDNALPCPQLGWVLYDFDNEQRAFVTTIGADEINNDPPKLNPTPAFASLAVMPNPFRSDLQMIVSVSENSKTSMSIYNMLGAKVADVAEEIIPAGSQTYTFDASALPSGMYLCRLIVTAGKESRIIVRKLVKEN